MCSGCSGYCILSCVSWLYVKITKNTLRRKRSSKMLILRTNNATLKVWLKLIRMSIGRIF
ncbi:hypothetical protein MKW92_025607 [Papaver armeniacum]|nr:hypothetical protein MKW92_025607 [Papaver armeniacum]